MTFPETFETFLAEIERREPINEVTQNFAAVVEIARQDPSALYDFFLAYNRLNAEIASTIAALVANIGRSRNLFIDPNCSVIAEADFSFEVAEWIKQASINEYGDPDHRDQAGKVVSHRTLAAGLLKAIGDYAGLTNEERNERKLWPWVAPLCDDLQKVYSGEEDNLGALSIGMGVHIMSEWMADAVEFNNAAKILFVDQAGEGFSAYLKDHPTITLRGQTFLSHAWLKTHGGYDEATNSIIHGAEYRHLETGYNGAKLAADTFNGKQRDIVIKGVFEGITACRKLLDRFFVESRKELLTAYPRLQPAPQSAPELPGTFPS